MTALEELGRILELLLPLDQLAEPREALRVFRRCRRRALLVLPVRGDALLGDPVHLVGADLDLDALAPRTDDRRVERLVHVGLGQRDVVLEAPRHRRPLRVHDAERRVAVGSRSRRRRGTR